MSAYIGDVFPLFFAVLVTALVSLSLSEESKWLMLLPVAPTVLVSQLLGACTPGAKAGMAAWDTATVRTS